MASKPRTSKATDDTADILFARGLELHAAEVPSILRGGVTLSRAELLATLKGRVAARASTAASKAAWQDAVAQERATLAASKATVSAVRCALAVMFAGHAELLGDFGLEVRKERRKLTNDEKAASAAKARATRDARHTMGPRAKSKIRAV
ncbi:MAG TPA: hypothetical protein VIF09_23775 [Polyangiaceae bacterium]